MIFVWIIQTNTYVHKHMAPPWQNAVRKGILTADCQLKKKKVTAIMEGIQKLHKL